MKSSVDKFKNRVKEKSDEMIDHSKVVVEKWLKNSQHFIEDFLQSVNSIFINYFTICFIIYIIEDIKYDYLSIINIIY